MECGVHAALRTAVANAAIPGDASAVTMGVRPEHMTIVPGNALTVELTEALGGVSYAYLRAPDGSRLIVEERGDERSTIGDKVDVSFEDRRVMFFDATTGVRLR